jgi:hypothetical protein
MTRHNIKLNEVSRNMLIDAYRAYIMTNLVVLISYSWLPYQRIIPSYTFGIRSTLWSAAFHYSSP